jgi:hypothetical protein
VNFGSLSGKWTKEVIRPFLIVFSLLLLCSALAAQPDVANRDFIRAREAGDYAGALAVCKMHLDKGMSLPEAVFEDPSFFDAGKVVEAAPGLKTPLLKTLISVQEAFRLRPGGCPDCRLRQQGYTAIFFRDQLDKTYGSILRNCLVEGGLAMPFVFVEYYAGAFLSDFEAKRLRREAVADEFLFLQEWLDAYSFIEPQQEGVCASIDRMLDDALRNWAPSCESLRKDYDDRAARNLLKPSDYKYLFAAAWLGECSTDGFQDTVLIRLALLNSSPYFHRILGQRYLEKEKYFEASRQFEQALQLEADPRLQARDRLQLAGIFLLRQNFRTARIYARLADELYPDWGMPWLFQAEMVIKSAPFCEFTPIERKALYWLAMDYCEEAARRNPSLSAEVAQKLADYRRHLPSPQELRLYNLQAGDRFPIRCWLETVARVRF